jgi:succinate dehydrogenase / fumarate reductase cytochrome b subunit
MNADKRPVNLNLLTIRFPVTALASILHRVTGVFLFLAIPSFLYGFQQALASAASFDKLQVFIAHPAVKIWIGLVICAFYYHLLAGFRHILMDFGVGEEKSSGRMTAMIVIALSIIFSIAVGIRLW